MDLHAQIVAGLLRQFNSLSEKNPSFSMRAYAKKLDIASGQLTEYFNGKRRLSNQTLNEIAKIDFVEPEVRSLIREYVGHAGPSSYTDHAPELENNNATHLVTNWEYFPVLALLSTAEADPTAKFICSRLPISTERAEYILADLMKSGVLEVSHGKSVINIQNNSRVTLKQFDSDTIRKSHINNHLLAAWSLENIGLKSGEAASAVMAVTKDQFQMLEAMVREFGRQVITINNEENPTEVVLVTASATVLKNRSQSPSLPEGLLRN